jgi:DNA modification methylase
LQNCLFEPPQLDKHMSSTDLWDISESISELAYLTHNFFRYYGKFPSLIGKNLVREFAMPNHVVLDNYAGSGTTLVEAKLAGYNSIGVDINPLAILACRVKCRNYPIDELTRRWQNLKESLEEHFSFLLSTDDLITERSRYSYQDSLVLADAYLGEVNGLEKWFSQKTRRDLAIVKSCIEKLPLDIYRDFFTLAFLAIIRRTSNAFDGEIRPHINRDKKPRPVWKAFIKKVKEMIEREREWVQVANPQCWAEAQIADNRKLSSLDFLHDYKIGLIVSHPPYLNSFDYLPVFNLEFAWAKGFEEVWDQYDLQTIRKMEIRAWPATEQRIFDAYFEDQRKMLAEAFNVLVKGGRCCVVIGDATIRKRLIPVVTLVGDIGQDVGFTLERIIYRTTHYGVGKYAYNYRADYHSDEDGKKDGILVFRRER